MSAVDQWSKEYYKLARIEEKMNEQVLKIEMRTLRRAMKKFDSMSNFTVEHYEDWMGFTFNEGPKKYLILAFAFPRGTKKKPDTTMRFIQYYVQDDIYKMLASVFPKYDAKFDCVRIDPHQDVWEFNLWHK